MTLIHIKPLHGPRPPRSVPVTQQAFISTETCHRCFAFSLSKTFANPPSRMHPRGPDVLPIYRDKHLLHPPVFVIIRSPLFKPEGLALNSLMGP